MRTAIKLEFNQRAAKRFLDAFCQGDSKHEDFAFQTFDDDKQRKPALINVHTTKPDGLWAEYIERLNNAGASIFVTVNRTDGQGRKNNNVTGIRALFVDFDGSPIKQRGHEVIVPPTQHQSF
jgi:hypothetical protein